MSPISRLVDRRGMAAVEFALLVPFMLLLLLGAADLVTWMRSWLQVTRAASEVGQIIGQYITLHEADFTGTFYPIAQSIAGNAAVQCDPKNVTNGNVVISGITTSSGKPTVSWQRNWGTCITSQIGQQGKSATLPTGYVPPNGAAVIVVEVWATQPPFVLSKMPGFMHWSGASGIRSYAIVTTRNGVLPAVQQ